MAPNTVNPRSNLTTIHKSATKHANYKFINQKQINLQTAQHLFAVPRTAVGKTATLRAVDRRIERPASVRRIVNAVLAKWGRQVVKYISRDEADRKIHGAEEMYQIEEGLRGARGVGWWKE